MIAHAIAAGGISAAGCSSSTFPSAHRGATAAPPCACAISSARLTSACCTSTSSGSGSSSWLQQAGACARPTATRRRAAASLASVRCSSTDGDGAQCPIDEELIRTDFIAETLLPTRHGKFRLRGYRHTVDGGCSFTEPTAIMTGKVEGAEDVLCRVHDACYTSEVLGSLKCDCAEQLQLAMEIIRGAPPGLVIYLQQEGRGIGLANKIAAYALQERGLDTVDANRALGLPDDCREYSSARDILADLGVKSIRLVTNNPRKLSQLADLGVQVTGRVPCVVQSGEFNEGYLSTKESRMDHMLTYEQVAAEVVEGSMDDDEVAPFCYWNHAGEPGPSGLPLAADAVPSVLSNGSGGDGSNGSEAADAAEADEAESGQQQVAAATAAASAAADGSSAS